LASPLFWVGGDGAYTIPVDRIPKITFSLLIIPIFLPSEQMVTVTVVLADGSNDSVIVSGADSEVDCAPPQAVILDHRTDHKGRNLFVAESIRKTDIIDPPYTLLITFRSGELARLLCSIW
jgi:hypothetical protein